MEASHPFLSLGNPPAAFIPRQEMALTSPKEKGRAQEWVEVVSDLPARLPHGQWWEVPLSHCTTPEPLLAVCLSAQHQHGFLARTRRYRRFGSGQKMDESWLYLPSITYNKATSRKLCMWQSFLRHNLSKLNQAPSAPGMLPSDLLLQF